MSTKRLVSLIMALCLPLVVIACGGGGGGGGGGGSASSLMVASQVSVVDPKLSGSVGGGSSLRISFGSLITALTGTAFASSSDYNTDRTNVWVADRTTDAFRTINEILCMMGQTKYDAMLNQGDYIALVDRNQCKSNNSDASSGGQQAQNQSSGANMPDYDSFTVNSSRADNSSPQYVKVWVHEPASDRDPAALIYGHLVITEGTSSTNPYGIFTMNFAGYDVPVADLNNPRFKGTLRAYRDNAGKVLLQFASNSSYNDGGGPGTDEEAITLDRAIDGSTGAGRVFQSNTNSGGTSTTDFDIAFNQTDFFRKDLITAGTPTVCLNRTTFNESSWSYGLYDGTGARKTLNSGFPIIFGPSNQYRGFVGYWGIWTENNAPLGNGDPVIQVDYRSNTQTPYTIFEAGGKLKKHTKQNLTLADIQNIPLGYWEQPVTGGTGTQYQVVWDGTNFNKTAQMPQNCGNNCTWANISQPYPTIDVGHLAWGNLNFWSQSLGGQAQVLLSGCTYTGPGGQYPNGYTSCSSPTNGTQVIFYAESVVYPGDTVPATLTCYDNCLDPALLGQAANNPYFPNGYSSGTPTAYGYTLSTDVTTTNGMVLLYGSSPVTSGTNTYYPWGIQSGVLFDATQANLDLLDCNWDADNNPATSPATCSWKAWSVLPVFYTWETGPNTWNRFIGVKDAGGTFVVFDAPLQVQYVHHQADSAAPDYKYNNVTFMLQYGGFGNLWGIPGKCVNMDTGADTDCSTSGGGNSIRWVPEFTIPRVQADGVTLTEATVNSTTYYVKPLEVEQRMKLDDPSNCSTLAATDFSGYTLPDMSIFTDPVTADGPEPTVTSPPAVIGGVVQ